MSSTQSKLTFSVLSIWILGEPEAVQNALHCINKILGILQALLCRASCVHFAYNLCIQQDNLLKQFRLHTVPCLRNNRVASSVPSSFYCTAAQSFMGLGPLAKASSVFKLGASWSQFPNNHNALLCKGAGSQNASCQMVIARRRVAGPN